MLFPIKNNNDDNESNQNNNNNDQKEDDKSKWLKNDSFIEKTKKTFCD